MNKNLLIPLWTLVALGGCATHPSPYQGLGKKLIHPKGDQVIADSIMYHPVRLDEDGHILPWYAADPGMAYDHTLNLVWNFWKNMRVDTNGLKYYMNHQVWEADHDDKRGLGGDQLMMALSSWNLLYNYSGDQAVLDNMKYIADYYLAHSLSSPTSQWPDLPYPYNTVVASGIYDGDMILGKGYLQPDKAGSFGFELIHLYKKTGEERYLAAAVKIANTLAAKVKPEDNDHSPWPFKVNAITGQTGILAYQKVWHEGMSNDSATWKNPANQASAYTTNWTGTMGLFEELIDLDKGNTQAYKKAFILTLQWLKTFPVKTNKWGPFFEDVPGWSDTQINAITYARFLLTHPALDSNWRMTVKAIFDWVHQNLDNKEFVSYGVTCINEQTAYRVPGNSHSSREASTELMYWEMTGDTTYMRNDVRMLNWATYMVAADGRNCYPRDGIWMTDGYGDYVRHYLRAMAAAPQLSPEDKDHLLSTSSIVKKITYDTGTIAYTVFDRASREVFRLRAKPAKITVQGQALSMVTDTSAEGWLWQPLDKGGILRLKQGKGNEIKIIQ